MRMWMIKPELLCNKHLLGEHGEIHKHRHNFVKHHSITNRVKFGQIEPEAMKTRHDEIAHEMVLRGMNHKSPYEMPDLSYLPEWERYAKVDVEKSKKDLSERCPNCKRRIENDP